MEEDIFKDNLPSQSDDQDDDNGSKREGGLRDTIKELKDKLRTAEKELSRIAPLSKKPTSSLEGDVYYGEFDGENMMTEEGKIFAVPPNYASKSKMVEGDELKLTITPSGSFIFKQIHPVERKRIIGVLDQQDNGEYVVKIGSKPYKVLLASVTYYRAQPGDEVAVILPSDKEATFAALDSVVAGGDSPKAVGKPIQAVVENYSEESADQDATFSTRKPKDYDQVGTNLADKNLGKLEGDEDVKDSMLNDNLSLDDEDELI